MSQDNYLLADIEININKQDKPIEEPQVYNFSSSYFKNNEHDFFLHVENVARYRVQNGEKVEIMPYRNADDDSINVFLESSVLGALLHQRGLLSFHGSSFLYKNKGIMICGDRGAGKSSITAAFKQCGALFITDDVSPVLIVNSKLTILPVKKRIKLWEDALHKLEISTEKLNRVRPRVKKFYLPVENEVTSDQPLDQIFIVHTHNKNEYISIELKGMDKFDALRSQIFRKSYLKGMPETEKKYFAQLFALANKVKVNLVFRPEICHILETKRFIEKEIEM